MLRVVVVDDSVTARECLIHILNSDPGIQVVGVAKNGVQAVRLAEQLHPHVITMDIQMPVMNGFEATREIMIASPRPIIIVSASTQSADSENAMRALKAGALTLIAKPVGPYSAGYQQAAQQLIETVKMMAEVKVIRRRRPFHPDGKAIGSSAARPQAHARIIAMAASTGGPPALQSVLSRLPASFPAPILVVQHLAVGFMPGLASWLDASLALSVKIAENAEVLLPGQVYIAPENCHLGVTPRGTAVLSDAPAIDGFRPSANFLFESVAKSFAAQVLAVILTGMGRDGVQGLRALHSAGGKVLAQDPLSCVVNGMPGAAVAAKVVHQVLSLEEIAKALQASTKQIC